MTTKSNIEKRREARQIYLKHGGKIHDHVIGEMVGLSRVSVGKARRQERWKEELDGAVVEVRERVADLVGDTAEKAFERYLANLSGLNERIERLLAGRELKPSEVAALAQAAARIVQTHRLLAGESTSNVGVNAKIQKDRSPGDDAKADHVKNTFDRLVEDGSPEAQEVLQSYAICLQNIFAFQKDKHTGLSR